jgi:hypothetical protein
MNANDWLADEILAIPVDQPERLFGADSSLVKKMYREFAKYWHTDTNKSPIAKKVVAHVNVLHDAAMKKIADNTWQEPGFFQCKLNGGKTFRVRSDATRKFELGEMHISPTTLTFHVAGNTDLVERFYKRDHKWADTKMADAFRKSVPSERAIYEAPGAYLITVKKRLDDILLRDLIPHLVKHKDTERHAAWIISRLLGMCRYLDWAGLNHNAITADTVFVSPANHTIGLFGGWWYHSEYGKKPIALPGVSMPYMKKKWQGEIDRAMVRDLGLEILGDRNGTGLEIRKKVPAEILSFLLEPSIDSQRDLETWFRVVEKSWGQRRFLQLNINYRDVYGEI